MTSQSQLQTLTLTLRPTKMLTMTQSQTLTVGRLLEINCQGLLGSFRGERDGFVYFGSKKRPKRIVKSVRRTEILNDFIVRILGIVLKNSLKLLRLTSRNRLHRNRWGSTFERLPLSGARRPPNDMEHFERCWAQVVLAIHVLVKLIHRSENLSR